MIQSRRQVLLNAVTATTTSNSCPVDNAGNLSIQITGANITIGSATFTFQVSNDGTNWVSYNRLISNVTNTNAQTDTKIASVLIGTNSGSMLFKPVDDTFNFIRVVGTVNNSADGNYTAVAYVN